MSESAAKSHGPLQVEYRRSKRYHVLRRCVVRPAAKADAEGWRSFIFDFSAYGVGMTLPFPMRPGALVEIVPHAAPGAPALRARVIHTRPLAHIWLCGCELETVMSEPGVRAWLAGTPA